MDVPPCAANLWSLVITQVTLDNHLSKEKETNMALERWSFDLVHSSINFWVRHMMVSKVHGRFGQWTGTLDFDEQNPSASRLDVQIDAASIDTREAQRDAHLKSADFFDVEKYPQLTFKGTQVTSTAPGVL